MEALRHHWQFAYTSLHLVRCVLGVEAAGRLRASFDEHRVKYRPPRKKRRLTPGQLAELRDRHAKARAARRPEGR